MTRAMVAMQTRRAVVALAGVAILTVAACGDGDGNGGGATTTTVYAPVIDPASFTADVTNTFFPLAPGTRWVYEGQTDEGTERVVVEVTDETKTVMGVTCVVVRDTVSLDGSVIEDTFDWFAQDADGNVWYFGEDSKEIEDGKVVNTEGSWEAGVDGALPGIVMPANPTVGETYRQEYYPGEAEDMGKVISLDDTAVVPFGSYEEVLVTEDFTPLEPDVLEHKYYASGVGVVLEVAVKGAQERVELIEFTTP